MTVIQKSITSCRAVHTDGLEEADIRKLEYLFQVAQYDPKGQLILEEAYTPDAALEHKSTYTYNDLGQLTEEILMEGDGFISEHKSMEYDETGRLVKEFLHYNDGSFDETLISYNSDGLVVKRETTDSEGESGHSVVFGYESGRLLWEREMDEEENILGEKTYEYDAAGNLVTESVSGFDEEFTLTHEYDEHGNRSISRRYNAEGHLVEKNTYTRDEQGRVVEIKEESKTGVEFVKMEFDAAGNNTKQFTLDSNDKVISTIERQYDEFGKILSTQVNIAGSGQRPPQDYRIRFVTEYY